MSESFPKPSGITPPEEIRKILKEIEEKEKEKEKPAEPEVLPKELPKEPEQPPGGYEPAPEAEPPLPEAAAPAPETKKPEIEFLTEEKAKEAEEKIKQKGIEFVQEEVPPGGYEVGGIPQMPPPLTTEERNRRAAAFILNLPETATWGEIEARREQVKKAEEEAEKQKAPVIPAAEVAAEAAPEAKAEEVEFDFDKALATPGFFEFLNRRAGQKVEVLNKNEVKKFYDAFEVGNLTKDFYKEAVKNETGLEIDEPELQNTLEAHFVAQKDASKYFERLRSAFDEYKEIPGLILEKEKELEELGGKEKLTEAEKELMAERSRLGSLGIAIARIEKQKELVQSMHGIRGFFNYKNSSLIGWIFRSKEESEARKMTMQEWQKTLDDMMAQEKAAGERAGELGAQVEALRKPEEVRQELEKRKTMIKGFFASENFEPAKDIMAALEIGIKELLTDLADPKKKDIKKLAAGLELMEKLEKGTIAKIGKSELEKFTHKFNELVEQKASHDILAKIKKLDLGKLKDMGAKLDAFFESLQKTAAKDIKVSQEFVRNRLESYLKTAVPPKGETAEGFRAKKLAVKMLLLKHGY